MNLVIALTIGVLYSAGVWLLLQRSLSRIVIGLAVIGHGANLLLLAAGGPGGEPPIAGGDVATTADPLPQALALTAIVITFGVSAFLLSMAYRNWVYRADDEVEDDVEDRRIREARLAIEADQARTEELHDDDSLDAANDGGVAR